MTKLIVLWTQNDARVTRIFHCSAPSSPAYVQCLTILEHFDMFADHEYSLDVLRNLHTITFHRPTSILLEERIVQVTASFLQEFL